MSKTKELFITAINLVEVNGRTNIPTALFYGKAGVCAGYNAFETASEPNYVSEGFKLELGRQDISVQERKQIEVATGEYKSAHALTNDFIQLTLKQVNEWIRSRGLKTTSRILVAEPLNLEKHDSQSTETWLSNYRSHLRRILEKSFKDVDFLPEPFAVFQYYRYGIKHPLVASQTKHQALVIDFGGGTFDVCVIETTAQGDISAGGKNSRPLAAASVAVGGSYINWVIAETLVFSALDKDVEGRTIRDALNAYRKIAAEGGDQSKLRSDYQNVIKNFRKTLGEVEGAKLAISNGIRDWGMEAKLDPLPKYNVKVPKNPLKSESEWGVVSLDGYKLREIFEKHVWEKQLKSVVTNALSRAKKELAGKPISIVLLSGGSANLRWLLTLLERDLKIQLGSAEILQLQENFQEIVAKGLAVECARRSYNKGEGDFKAVTYNQLCLVLSSDEKGPETKIFRRMGQNGQSSRMEPGVLIPSASEMSGFIDCDLRWKVTLSRPPRHFLDYWFLKSSVDVDDYSNLHNVENHRVQTPPKAAFDGSIVVNLNIREDGTAIPSFIYSQGNNNVKPTVVKGVPFYIDMTYATPTQGGGAYIGFDFGTSNSSYSYIEQAAVNEYTRRAQQPNWYELNDLVRCLPYPVSVPLARFISETQPDRLLKCGFDAFESFLTLAAYICYADYRSDDKEKSTRLFKGFTNRSVGPLWGLIKQTLGHMKEGRFSKEYQALLDDPLRAELEAAVDDSARAKHFKGGENINYVHLLGQLGNVTARVFSDLCFGSFESVSKVPFKKNVFQGNFRSAHGPSHPFIDILQYEGGEAMSEEEVYVCNWREGKVLMISPFYLWLADQNGMQLDEKSLVVFDNERDGLVSYKVVGRSAEAKLDSLQHEEIRGEILSMRSGDGGGAVFHELKFSGLTD